jgi:tetratricopeptide (TPR) repeat protein
VLARKKTKSATKSGGTGRVTVKAPARKPLQIAPPVVEPVRRQVASGAVRAFEQAMRVFNRRQFAEARSLFEGLQGRFPQEVEILARAQTYMQVCNQKLARQSASPRDADELYDRGVVALNIGDFTQARSLFEKALRMRPNEPHLLYSLAATYAQSGSSEEALDYLHRSIQIQPRYRTQAMNDADFSGLHTDKRFLEILGVTSPFDLLEARR